jgi:AcrR family transcriptional regulator
MAKRSYEQRLRAETADANRQRILDALYERLGEAPARLPTVDEIAARAGVARSTIYVVFGSRRGLFDALLARLLSGAGYDQLLEAVARPDPRETLRGGLAGGVHMYAEHETVWRVLHSMAKLDPDGVGQTIAVTEATRTRGMASLAERLAEQGCLRRGLTAERAAHVIWVLASFDAYDQLAAGRGLGTDEIAGILVETAENALLA